VKTYVRIECENCPWRHDVPAEDIGVSGGIPYALRYPEHDCPAGGQCLLERAGCEAELVTTMPAYTFKVALT
jgi:hypothetical protein